ncbi:hypothetical protein [Rhizobium sp. Leaf262]|nr:hypothetical protein [Rhizobium sp. Leaf262]
MSLYEKPYYGHGRTPDHTDAPVNAVPGMSVPAQIARPEVSDHITAA